MWSDREADRDLLNFSTYVAVLSEICTHADFDAFSSASVPAVSSLQLRWRSSTATR